MVLCSGSLAPGAETLPGANPTSTASPEPARTREQNHEATRPRCCRGARRAHGMTAGSQAPHGAHPSGGQMTRSPPHQAGTLTDASKEYLDAAERMHEVRRRTLDRWPPEVNRRRRRTPAAYSAEPQGVIAPVRRRPRQGRRRRAAPSKRPPQTGWSPRRRQS